MHYQFQFDAIFESWPMLLQGTLNTIQLSLGAMVIGLLIAIFCSWGKNHGGRLLCLAIDTYIEVVRNTPFLVQLFFFFFALPSLGVQMTATTAALVTMFVNLGAFATEILRAGIEAVPKGQVEAGMALNLKRYQVFLHVVLRPALKTIFPALSSQFILLMLTSSIVSAVSADDLASVAANIQSETFRSFEIYITVTIIYFVLSLMFMGLFKVIWRNFLYYPEGR
ncbi:MAG: amino acid ABC transporter permease [Castellaniella sp.]|jgi:polar amino acid transport system permease protein|uniref:amino acid ABC transporter permease n=1 Tax=Castellaniella sp. TaxID=1955812 RepID=UPI003C783719